MSGWPCLCLSVNSRLRAYSREELGLDQLHRGYEQPPRGGGEVLPLALYARELGRALGVPAMMLDLVRPFQRFARKPFARLLLATGSLELKPHG